METIQDYRHIETREGLFDSKELPTYIPLMSHVQTLRKNDTKQDSTKKNTQTKHMEGALRHSLGSQAQHTLFGRPYMVYPTEHHHTH